MLTFTSGGFRSITMAGLILAVPAATSAQSQPPSRPFTAPPVPNNPSATDEDVTLQVSLSARQESLPPLGIPADSMRDTGFATVVLHLSNRQRSLQQIILRSIEIVSEPDHQVQPFPFRPQVISLQPLENAVIDIHLSSRTGFTTMKPLRALIHYQLESGPLAVARSEPIRIERQSAGGR